MNATGAPVPSATPRSGSQPGGLSRQLASAIELLRGRRVAVLTGAGCSTESGIPDYGGLKSPTRSTRIQYRAFVGDPGARRRYWARSVAGWPRVAQAAPNPAHAAIAALERGGAATGVITQNVDGLHQRAGSSRVVELHGSLARVRCLDCGSVMARSELQVQLTTLNPHLTPQGGIAAPDGDAELADDAMTSLRVPACAVCGGVLKPDVVFFGENVPRLRVDRAWQVFHESEVLLVAGSSLAVFSGYRFVLRAAKEHRPVVIVNEGDTRGDSDAAVKIDARVETVLPRLAEELAR